MPSVKKQEKVKKYDELLSELKSMVIVDYRGLSVADANELRTKSREADITYQVVKNNLFKIALEKNKDLKNLGDIFVGTRAVAISKNDEIAPMKVLSQFTKKNEKIKIIAGFFNGEILDDKAVDTLAKLPSRDELFGQIAAGIQAPSQYIACGINGVLQKLAVAINGIREKLEEEQKSA